MNVDPNADPLYVDAGVHALVIAMIIGGVLCVIIAVFVICKMVQAGNQMLGSISRFIHRNDHR